jgi:hypothetical protein
VLPARADHQHAFLLAPLAAPPSVAAASAIGVSPKVARGDHTHLGVSSIVVTDYTQPFPSGSGNVEIRSRGMTYASSTVFKPTPVGISTRFYPYCVPGTGDTPLTGSLVLADAETLVPTAGRHLFFVVEMAFGFKGLTLDFRLRKNGGIVTTISYDQFGPFGIKTSAVESVLAPGDKMAISVEGNALVANVDNIFRYAVKTV